MGEPNNALNVYMSRADRIRSVLEYYLGEKLPEDWNCEEIQERNVCSEEKYSQEDDFKYRYRKADRIEPVLNLTLYWGRKEWKEPCSLKAMMCGINTLPEKLQALAGDYQVHLIQMRAIAEDDLQKMDSDLKYVLGIMKRTASPIHYKRYIRENREYFSRIPKSAVDVINACTHIKNIQKHLKYTFHEESGEEVADMCKALDIIERDAVKRGLKRGVKQGMEQGKRIGTLATLFSLVNDGLLKLDEAARRAKLSEAAFSKEMKKAGY